MWENTSLGDMLEVYINLTISEWDPNLGIMDVLCGHALTAASPW
jgi:hypothetical protein